MGSDRYNETISSHRPTLPHTTGICSVPSSPPTGTKMKNLSCSIIKCHSLVLNNMCDSSSTTLQAYFHSSVFISSPLIPWEIQHQGGIQDKAAEKGSAVVPCPSVPTIS